MQEFYQTIFSWIPQPIAGFIAALFALAIVFMVMRLVKTILDTLPFM